MNLKFKAKKEQKLQTAAKLRKKKHTKKKEKQTSIVAD